MTASSPFNTGAAWGGRWLAVAGTAAVVLVLLLIVLPSAWQNNARQKNALAEATNPLPNDNSLSALLARATASREAGQFNVAEQYLTQATAQLRTSAAPADNIRLFDALSALRADQRRLADAVVALEQSIALAGNVYGLQSREVAYRYERMALLYQRMQQPIAALLSRERTLRIAEKDPAVNRDALAMNFNNLGELFRQQGDFVRADDAYATALRIIVAHRGAGAPETIFPLNNTGLSALAQGNFDVAEVFLRRAYEAAQRAKRPQAVGMIETNLTALAKARTQGVPAHLKIAQPEEPSEQ